MSEDAIAGPSFLLARHDIAHREHLHQHQHQHQHHHLNLHKRQAEPAAEEDQVTGVVTVVAATVSVIQQIDVDSNGNTFSVLLVPAPTEDPSPSLTDASPGVTSPSDSILSSGPSVASSIPTNTPSSTISDQSTISVSPSSSATSASTSIPSITPTSNFASLIVSSNSTTLITSSSSLNPTFSNSTHSTSTSSNSRSSSSNSLTSSGSSTYRSSKSGSSTSSYYSPTSSIDPTSTSTDGGDGAFIAGGETGVTSGAGSSSTSSIGGGSKNNSDDSPATSTPVIVGSVVSSIAGAALLVFAIIFLWRWKKRRSMLSLGSGAPGGQDTITEGPPSQPSGGMTERRSMIQAVPAALASLTGYKRSSQKTERTISSTAGSERGFYRVSGRKLPSVLQSGGDGYGDVIDNRNANTLSGTSFYRDSSGFYGGPGSPSMSPIGISTQRDSGIPVMRPSPARTPVTEHGPFFPMPPPPPPINTSSPTHRPDVLGRSHPSQDGSHTSRFTEEV